MPARHLGVVVGPAHGEDVGEPRRGVQTSPPGVVESAALDLERPHAPRAEPRRVSGFGGHEIALGLVVVTDEPCDALAKQDKWKEAAEEYKAIINANVRVADFYDDVVKEADKAIRKAEQAK